ncbi:MAG: tetratricopeptide repeat protein [Chitinophagaceae bacterium]
MNYRQIINELFTISILLAFFSCNYSSRRNDVNRKEVGRNGLIEVTIQSSRYDSAYQEASALLQENNTSEAISIYDRLCKIENDSLKTFSFMGLASAYVMAGDYENAIENYNTSIRFNSKNVDSYVGLGSTYSRLGDYRKSIENYNNAKNLNPNSADCYWGLALTYYELNFKDSAKVYAKQFIELEPQSKYRYLAEKIIAK